MSEVVDIFGLPTLYVVPVSIVFVACLIVFALGFKSSAPLPPSFDSTITVSKKKSKQTVAKVSSTSSKSSQSNDKKQTNAKQGTPKAASKSEAKSVPKEKQTEKPKAVVKPLPAELVEVNEADVDGGDWIPVLSEKQKKKASKAVKDSVADRKVVVSSDEGKKTPDNNKNRKGRRSNAVEETNVINIQEIAVNHVANHKVNQDLVEKVLAKIERIENEAPGQLTSQLNSSTWSVLSRHSIWAEENGQTWGRRVNSWGSGSVHWRQEIGHRIRSRSDRKRWTKRSSSGRNRRPNLIQSLWKQRCNLRRFRQDKQLPGDKITYEMINSYDGQTSETVSKNKKKKSAKKVGNFRSGETIVGFNCSGWWQAEGQSGSESCW